MKLKKSRFPSTASMLMVVLALVALMLAWQSPLFGTPTAEAALFLGLFLAPSVMMAGVCRGALRGNAGFHQDVYREGVWIFFILLFYLSVLGLHALVLESCSDSAGFLPFLILIVPQACLNLVTGVWIGRLVGHVKAAVLLTLVLWVFYFGAQLLLWFLHPSMRFFEPYWFLIVGDLLKGQSLDLSLVMYRLSALFYAAALFVFGLSFKKHATQFWLLFFLLGSAVFLQVKSTHAIEPSYAQRYVDYPDLLTEGSLFLHTNLSQISKQQAEGVLQEATLWKQRLTKRTGIDLSKTVHIWLYQDRESLAHHTGAKNVHFTLPSHAEIHITSAEVPHPTLGHEMAHVFLGQVSTTLWGIPGIFGIIPNWGLSEGLCTYLTPELEIREDLTLEEQASALFRLGLERHPEELLSTDLWSFWSQASLRAYVSAAALLKVYIKTPQDIQRLVQQGEIIFSDSFLKAYRLQMEQMPLPPDALFSVKKRFEPDSIFMATCSSETVVKSPEKTLEEQADALALKGSYAEALKAYDAMNLLELSIPKQREITIKKSFLKKTSYAQAGLELLLQKHETLLEVGAAYGKLGFVLEKPEQSDVAYDYALYLLARAEILSADFRAGLDLMPLSLEGWIGQESKRLVALAQSQTGQIGQAIAGFEALREQATRPADRLRFEDFSERARRVLEGQNFLLGVWSKP